MDSSGNSEKDSQPCATFHKWKYNHYFVITEEGEKISELVVSYVLETRPCHVPAAPPPTLENVHRNAKLEAWPVEGAKRKGKRPKADRDDDSDDESHVHQVLKRQCTLPSMLKKCLLSKIMQCSSWICHRRHAATYHCWIPCILQADGQCMPLSVARSKVVYPIFE